MAILCYTKEAGKTHRIPHPYDENYLLLGQLVGDFGDNIEIENGVYKCYEHTSLTSDKVLSMVVINTDEHSPVEFPDRSETEDYEELANQRTILGLPIEDIELGQFTEMLEGDE